MSGLWECMARNNPQAPKSVSHVTRERPAFDTGSRKILSMSVKRQTNLTSFWQKLSSPTAKEEGK